MGFFKKTPEERALLEQKKREEEKARQERAFAASPAGRARAARIAGLRIFQIDIPLSTTKGEAVALVGAFAHTSQTLNVASVIQAIEEEGWRLEHAGYIYRITGSVSRDKLLSSGQQEAVNGEIVGIYIFRAQTS